MTDPKPIEPVPPTEMLELHLQELVTKGILLHSPGSPVHRDAVQRGAAYARGFIAGVEAERRRPEPVDVATSWTNAPFVVHIDVHSRGRFICSRHMWANDQRFIDPELAHKHGLDHVTEYHPEYIELATRDWAKL